MAENNGIVTKAELKAALNIQRDEIYAAMSETFHDSETRMLKAFYGFVDAIQKRTVNVENGPAGVAELEKKINFPSAS